MTEPTATDPGVRGQTLEQVDGQPWGDPPADASYLMTRGYALRRVPLTELTTEDLRLLLGQSIGAPTLVPFALRVLADDPLAEGDFYPGDLLAAVLGLDDAYWLAHPEQGTELAAIARRVDPAADELTSTELPGLIAVFLAGQGGADSSG